MQEIKVNELKPHPKNDFFFDDMTGQKWTEFLDSVKTSGIIEPIVCTQNKVIVSGHQRVRACKELNIETIMCELRFYENKDKVIKDLIETNVRQRGDISSSSLKMGRIICELERIYGISKGNNQHTDNVGNQKDIAQQLGMSVDTLNNYKKLTTLIPEIQDMVSEDKISTSVASRILARLSPDEQEKLILTYGKNVIQGTTQKEVQEYVDKIKQLEQRVIDISQQKTKTEIITQERDNPETTKKLEELRKELNNKSEEYKKLFSNFTENQKLLNTAMGESTNWQLTSHCSAITKKMLDFISEMAKYDYMAENFNEIPIATRKEYFRCIQAVQKWSNNIINTINNENYIDVEEN